MDKQRFYILDCPIDYKIALVVVETELRLPNSGKQTVVKLHKKDSKEYPQLKGHKAYNYKNILKELEKEEWQPENDGLTLTNGK